MKLARVFLLIVAIFLLAMPLVAQTDEPVVVTATPDALATPVDGVTPVPTSEPAPVEEANSVLLDAFDRLVTLYENLARSESGLTLSPEILVVLFITLAIGYGIAKLTPTRADDAIFERAFTIAKDMMTAAIPTIVTAVITTLTTSQVVRQAVEPDEHPDKYTIGGNPPPGKG